MKTWFSIKAQAADSSAPAEISIHDSIGAWNINAQDFLAQLKAISAKDITLTINSPGGSVFDGVAIYNGLRNHGANITVHVLGVAASIASIIAMAGDKIIMPENTFMMVHSPLNALRGNAADMREMADLLDKVESSLIATYVARTGLSHEEIKALLDAETLMTASEAVKLGFADEMRPALKIAASFDLENLPENVQAIFKAAQIEDSAVVVPSFSAKIAAFVGEFIASVDVAALPENIRTVLTAVKNASPEDLAALDAAMKPPKAEVPPVLPTTKTFAAEVNTLATEAGLQDYVAAWLLDASLTTVDQAKAAINEALEVRALCEYAKKPEMAAQMIESRTLLIDARKELCAARAAETDKTTVNSTQPSNKQPTFASSGIAAWAKIFPPRNQAN